MKWKKYTLTTTTEAVDLISCTFDEIGIEGIEIEDNIPLTEKETKGMFIDCLLYTSCEELGFSQEESKKRLNEKFALPDAQAETFLEKYWGKPSS